MRVGRILHSVDHVLGQKQLEVAIPGRPDGVQQASEQRICRVERSLDDRVLHDTGNGCTVYMFLCLVSSVEHCTVANSQQYLRLRGAERTSFWLGQADTGANTLLS